MTDTKPMGRIINTRPTFLTTPGILADPNRPRGEYTHPPVKLQPGATNVEDAFLEALDKLPPKGAGKVWRDWVRLGWVKVIRAAAPEAKAELSKREGPEAPPTLEGIKDEGALALVQAEDSLEVLRMWFSSERRKAVKDAIQARMLQLNGGKDGGKDAGKGKG